MTIAALLIGLMAGPACSSASDEDPATASSTAEAEDGSGGASGDESGAGSEAGSGAAGESGDSDGGGSGAGDERGSDGEEAEPLASVSARLPAGPNERTLVPLRLDVLGLERLDGMVELRVALTHEGGRSDPDFEPYNSFDDPRLPTGEGIYSLSGAQLVDAEAERAYLTIVDSEGACLCTGRLSQVAVPPGETFEMYADFGGVPDDLDRVDVQIPGFPTVDALPIR
ncbi:MAG TPA: hypothetical protein VIL48_13385 [Acidimicrobiales bacterium]